MKRLGGWWRLWIFSSVIWGLLVLVVVGVWNWPTRASTRWLGKDVHHLFSPQVLRSMEVGKQNSEEIERMGLPSLPPGAVGVSRAKKVPTQKYSVPIPDESKDPLDGFVRVPTKVTMESGQEFHLDGTPDEIKTYKKDLERVQELVLRKDQRDWAFGGLRWWLVPSLSILAFGLGFRWVVRGFKKEPV